MFTTEELKAIMRVCWVMGANDIADKCERLIAQADFEGTVYLDLPDPHQIGVDETGWKSVQAFRSMPEAVLFIRNNVGHCDDVGNISLLTLGDPAK